MVDHLIVNVMLQFLFYVVDICGLFAVDTVAYLLEWKL